MKNVDDIFLPFLPLVGKRGVGFCVAWLGFLFCVFKGLRLSKMTWRKKQMSFVSILAAEHTNTIFVQP